MSSYLPAISSLVNLLDSLHDRQIKGGFSFLRTNADTDKFPSEGHPCRKSTNISKKSKVLTSSFKRSSVRNKNPAKKDNTV